MQQFLPAARGTAYGFEIRSKLAFRHLRNGEGIPLEVESEDISERPGRADKLLIEWKPPENNFSARLYDNGKRYLMFIAGTGWFHINPTEGRIIVPAGKDFPKIEDKMWGIPALLCFTARGDHALHADAVESNGGAILIAGPQRLGRSAITAGFAAAGHRVLSQDLACLRLTGNNVGAVPGPSMLRVPKSQAQSLDMSAGNGTWVENGGQADLDATRRGTCKPVPVRSVVILRDGPEQIESMTPAEAISDLWSMSFRLPTEDDRGRCFQGVADLASSVPVWNLYRNQDSSELISVVERIASISLEYA